MSGRNSPIGTHGPIAENSRSPVSSRAVTEWCDDSLPIGLWLCVRHQERVEYHARATYVSVEQTVHDA